jgi:hypothetical protein
MPLFKSKSIAAALFMALWIYFPAVSQEAESFTVEKKRYRFDLLSTFSYYPAKSQRINFQTDTIAPAAPAEYEQSHSYNLSLLMGMRLFKEWEGYVDFGIKEKNARRAIDLMGRVGPQYFSVQLDYTRYDGRIHLWDDTPFGGAALEAIRGRAADTLIDYNQTWMCVALMITPYYMWRLANRLGGSGDESRRLAETPREKSFFEAAAQNYYLGVFYSSATLPFLVASNVTKITKTEDGKTDTTTVPAEGAIAEFDPRVSIWAAGIRFGFGWGNHKSPYLALSSPGIRLFISCVMDIGIGKGRPDMEIAERMGNLNPDFQSSFISFYARTVANVGIYREFNTLGDRIIHIGGGYEFNYQNYRLYSSYYLPMDVGANHGAYVRLGLRF